MGDIIGGSASGWYDCRTLIDRMSVQASWGCRYPALNVQWILNQCYIVKREQN